MGVGPPLLLPSPRSILGAYSTPIHSRGASANSQKAFDPGLARSGINCRGLSCVSASPWKSLGRPWPAVPGAKGGEGPPETLALPAAPHRREGWVAPTGLGSREPAEEEGTRLALRSQSTLARRRSTWPKEAAARTSEEPSSVRARVAASLCRVDSRAPPRAQEQGGVAKAFPATPPSTRSQRGLPFHHGGSVLSPATSCCAPLLPELVEFPLGAISMHGHPYVCQGLLTW